jgi:ATP-binding cassette subfamily G (WHITE) protein 2 (SNQ2)
MTGPPPPHDTEKTTAAAASRENVSTDEPAPKQLTVTFRDVGIQVHGMGEDYAPTFRSVAAHFLWPFGREQTTTRHILKDVTGQVRPGEMLLVLGRPGSGCTSLLKILSNQRDEFLAVEGHVRFGSMGHKDAGRFRGQVVMNTEEDIHFPTLKVHETIDFATRTKLPAGAPATSAHISSLTTKTLATLGIEHTRDTIVGNEVVRGVSGGERKRVSLAETLATRASVVCWDNSTRGLDASTALSFAKSLRVYTDVSGRTTLVTLYQAGESIYELVDKVLVIDEGRMLFQGPAKEAKAYFEGLGYYCPPRQTTADFLTSVADKNVRRFQPGREAAAPKTPAELEQAFRASEHYRRLLADVDAYELDSKPVTSRKHQVFEATVKESKSKTVLNNSVYTVSFLRQVEACVQRQAWLIWGDKQSLATKAWVIIANGLIVGSLFFGLGKDTQSAYAHGSITFFSVVFLGWLQFAELLPAVSGRTTIERQRLFAFYRPSAVAIARVVLDFPMILSMVACFCLPIYFLGRFDVVASKFWIWFLFVFTTTFTLTSMYRMWASISSNINDAVRFVGFVLNLLFMFGGYVVPRTQLMSNSPWFGWISYANPMTFGYEALMSSEFANQQMECAETMLVPRGPGVDDARYQGCAFSGSRVGSTVVSGEDYIYATYGFTRAHLWRNFGILIALALGYIAVTVFAVERIRYSAAGAQSLVFAGTSRAKKSAAAGDAAGDEKAAAAPAAGDDFEPIGDGRSVFTFKDVTYTVPTPAGPKLLLNKVSGYARPGKMIALMGRSGAGKTTLLHTLAQRQTTGVVGGEMLVNGAALGTGFQRGTGFCEQMDLHEGTATIREALEFSALLRQDAAVPRAEKLAYVDRIVGLLELEDLEDALVASLTVEQRKRVTIGVELAARPKLLLFLDEPTSGLDSQSALSTVRFLRRLCDAGQAIICTIHQPSSDLIEQFDMILALNGGGNTFYLGPVGENGSVVVDYFAKRGVPCPPGRNVAEFIIETASRSGTGPGQTDWDAEWLRSEERAAILAEIDGIVADGSKKGAAAAAAESSSTPAATEFASTTWDQCVLLTRRMFLQQWREPSYIYGRLFSHFLLGIFSGFTFWMLGNSVASLQNRMFVAAVFIFFVPPAVVNTAVFMFFTRRGLWEARELPSRTYGWVAFATASVVTEIPSSIICSTIYFVCMYFPTGMPRDAPTAGYFYALVLLYSLWMTSWGQWIAAFGPSVTVVSNLLPLFFVVVSLFNGVVVQYASFPVFWKYWIYYLMPSTWFVRGVLAAVLPQTPVECAPGELARFDPPPGSTCGEYARGFLEDVIRGQGYLVDGNATADCGYCAYTSGADYLPGLNIHDGDKKLAAGLLAVFVVANWALVYALVYSCRIRGWSFGFGYLTQGVDKVVALLSRKKEKKAAAGESA